MVVNYWQEFYVIFIVDVECIVKYVHPGVGSWGYTWYPTPSRYGILLEYPRCRLGRVPRVALETLSS